MKKLPEYNDIHNGNEMLQAPFIPNDIYKKIQEYTVIVCHDAFIKTTIKGENGILLVRRLREPAKDILWPIGGRLLRGLSAEDSLRKKIKDECGLDLTDTTYLRTARTSFRSDLYGHGHGSDTLNLVYWATSEGEVKLDSFHTTPTIITKENYPAMRSLLVPYVQDSIDIALKENLWK